MKKRANKRTKYMRGWRAKNRKKFNANNLKSYYKNREAGLVYRRTHWLKYKYGITVEIYETMLEAQGGKCFLCSSPPKKVRLHVDHDHKTGVVRHLLCATCNFVVGKLEAIGVDRFVEYLK